MTGVQTCALPICFPVTIWQIMEDARAVIAAKREAKAKAASFVATAMNDDDVPF